jgi:putative heme degradation protein
MAANDGSASLSLNQVFSSAADDEFFCGVFVGTGGVVVMVDTGRFRKFVILHYESIIILAVE